MKRKYEERYPGLKITDNPFMMIDDFRDQITILNIKLDKKDLDDLKDIISITGTTLNIRQIAKSIREYVEKTALFSIVYNPTNNHSYPPS